MTPREALVLTRYVKACCPQQAIDEYTPEAWHDLLGDLSLDDCREGARIVAQRQPFVAPAEIRAEVRRMRRERLARTPLAAPPAELTDQPGRYKQALDAGIERIASGFASHPAIAGPLPGDPPQAWTEARKALAPPPVPKADPQEAAVAQAEASRLERERRAAREHPEAS